MQGQGKRPSPKVKSVSTPSTFTKKIRTKMNISRNTKNRKPRTNSSTSHSVQQTKVSNDKVPEKVNTHPMAIMTKDIGTGKTKYRNSSEKKAQIHKSRIPVGATLKKVVRTKDSSGNIKASVVASRKYTGDSNSSLDAVDNVNGNHDNDLECPLSPLLPDDQIFEDIDEDTVAQITRIINMVENPHPQHKHRPTATISVPPEQNIDVGNLILSGRSTFGQDDENKVVNSDTQGNLDILSLACSSVQKVNTTDTDLVTSPNQHVPSVDLDQITNPVPW